MADQVFGTYELLENILKNLPFRDLLLSQRVSTCFQEVIATSKPLRRKLHLEPIVDSSQEQPQDPHPNASHHRSNDRVEYLPLLPQGIELFEGLSLGSRQQMLHIGGPGPSAPSSFSVAPPSASPLSLPHGSWRDMYPFQTPHAAIYTNFWWQRRLLVTRKKAGECWTLGMIVDAAREGKAGMGGGTSATTAAGGEGRMVFQLLSGRQAERILCEQRGIPHVVVG